MPEIQSVAEIANGELDEREVQSIEERSSGEVARREIPPSWKIANAVIRVHVLWALGTTATLTLGLISFIALFIYLRGGVVSVDVLYDILLKYRGIFLWLLASFHLGPVTLYAVIRSFTHKYRKFRVVIYAVDKPVKGAKMANVSTGES